MKKIHGSKNKRWRCQHPSCLDLLLIIQIFLSWSGWLQNESLCFLSQMKTEGLLLTNPICFLPSYEQRRSQGGQFSPFVHCPPAEPSCSSWCVLSPLHTAMVKLMVKVTIPKRNPLRAVWNRKRWRRRSHCIFGSSTPFYQLLWAWQEQHVPKAVNAAFYKCTVVKWGVKTEILGLVPKLSCWTKIAWLYKKKKKNQKHNQKTPKWCQT